VDADTNKDLYQLVDGAVLDLSVLPSINIRANVGSVASVQFFLNDLFFRIENAAPFALAGTSGK
jgi:hypothetical protein